MQLAREGTQSVVTQKRRGEAVLASLRLTRGGPLHPRVGWLYGSLHSPPFPSQYGSVPKQKQSYTVEELEGLAAGLGRLLGAIENGTMEADAGTISGLEGAAAAIQALAEGRNP
jgi:hypothetical protein